MKPINLNAITLREILEVLGFLLLVLLVLGYVAFQARNLIMGPVITLTGELPYATDEEVLTITGIARNTTDITLNGRTVYIDEQGVFTERLVLEAGYTIMTMTARDRFGRTTALTRTFLYTGEQPGRSTPPQTP